MPVTCRLHGLGKPQKLLGVDEALEESDFFHENAPASLKDRVPRIVYEEKYGFWNFTFNGRWLYPVGNDDEIRKLIKTVESHANA